MARSVTIANLITRAKQRADLVNDTHVSDAEWQVYLAEAYNELHAIVAETGSRQFEAEETITATGASSYNLPSAYLSTVSVEFVTDGSGARRPLHRLMPAETALYRGMTGEACAYELTGTTIVLWPRPSSGSYRHIYIPQPTDYSSSGTDIDCLNVYGEQFITWSAASMAIHKQERNAQFALMRVEKAREEIYNWAANRALEGNRRVAIDDQYEEWP